MQHFGPAVVSIALLLACADPDPAAAEMDGKALLESRCGRCHAVTAEETSRLQNAPNLWIVLKSYPKERLAFELAEGIGSKHPNMPQIQFAPNEIESVETYLFGQSGQD